MSECWEPRPSRDPEPDVQRKHPPSASTLHERTGGFSYCSSSSWEILEVSGDTSALDKQSRKETLEWGGQQDSTAPPPAGEDSRLELITD